MCKWLRSIVVATFGLLLAIMLINSPSEAKSVTKKNVTVLQGATKDIRAKALPTRIVSISNKKKLTAKMSEEGDVIHVKGKKTGTATISTKCDGIKKQTLYKVTVLSAKKVKTAANKKLKSYLKKQTKGTQYLYADLNQDGIKELCLKGKVIYYDYNKKKLMSQKMIAGDLYLSKKTGSVYVKWDKEEVKEEFVYVSRMYKVDHTKVFQLKDTETGFRTYTEKGMQVYGAKEPYSYYDFTYDQDDYEYEDMTEAEMEQKLETLAPQRTLLKWKTK